MRSAMVELGPIIDPQLNIRARTRCAALGLPNEGGYAQCDVGPHRPRPRAHGRPSRPGPREREGPDRSGPLASSAQASTAGQRNALSSAQDYLHSSAFSKSGLVEQLEYEDFSSSEARWAVAHVRVSWNAEAVESAKSYLRSSSFSRQGLIEQLEYEGFTHSQAAYGVRKAYR
jgi:host cell surface-exposed lipoprotein